MLRLILVSAIFSVLGCSDVNDVEPLPHTASPESPEYRYRHGGFRPNRDDAIRMRLRHVTATMISPTPGEMLAPKPFYEVKGTIAPRSIPTGIELVVLVQDHPFGNFYLSWPPVEVDHATGSWSASNVRIGTRGIWKIHLAAVNRSGQRTIRTRVRRHDFRRFVSLPEGCVILASTRVTRQ